MDGAVLRQTAMLVGILITLAMLVVAVTMYVQERSDARRWRRYRSDRNRNLGLRDRAMQTRAAFWTTAT